MLIETLETPRLNVHIKVENGAVTEVDCTNREVFMAEEHKGSATEADRRLMEETKQQLLEYFSGTRQTFDLPLTLNGTEFQRRVWAELQAIPYGQAISYQALAERIGNPKAVRAVGQANRRNPVAIVVPCHRVIGKDKTLKGYAGNQTPVKEWLLTLEKYL